MSCSTRAQWREGIANCFLEPLCPLSECVRLLLVGTGDSASIHSQLAGNSGRRLEQVVLGHITDLDANRGGCLWISAKDPELWTDWQVQQHLVKYLCKAEEITHGMRHFTISLGASRVGGKPIVLLFMSTPGNAGIRLPVQEPHGRCRVSPPFARRTPGTGSVRACCLQTCCGGNRVGNRVGYRAEIRAFPQGWGFRFCVAFANLSNPHPQRRRFIHRCVPLVFWAAWWPQVWRP